MLQALQEEMHEFFLKIRILDRIFCSIEFERAFDEAVDFRLLKTAIENLDLDLVKFWITQNTDPAELPLRQLRKLAMLYNIPRWSRQDKSELIESVQNATGVRRRAIVTEQIETFSAASRNQSGHADRRDLFAQNSTVCGRFRLPGLCDEVITNGESPKG